GDYSVGHFGHSVFFRADTANMTSNHQRPAASLWIAVALVVVVLAYPISFGPACWWCSREFEINFNPGKGWPKAPRIYWPMGWLARNGPLPIRRMIKSYALRRTTRIFLPTDSRGVSWFGISDR